MVDNRSSALQTKAELQNQNRIIDRELSKLNSSAQIRNLDRSGLIGRNQSIKQLQSTRGQINQNLQNIDQFLNQPQENRIEKLTRIIRQGLKGSVGSEFSNLTRSEQKIVSDTISEITDSAELNQGLQAVRNLEKQLNTTFGTDLQRGIIKEANQRSGLVDLSITSSPASVKANLENLNVQLPQSQINKVSTILKRIIQPSGFGITPDLESKSIKAGISTGGVNQVVSKQINEKSREFKQLVSTLGSKQLALELIKGTYLIEAQQLVKTPTREDYLALLTAPIFFAETAGSSQYQEVRSATGELKGFKKKPSARDVELLTKDIQEFFATSSRPIAREKVREIVNLYRNDPTKLASARRVITEAIGKASADSLFEDILAQEGLLAPKVNVKGKTKLTPKLSNLDSPIISPVLSKSPSTLQGSGAETQFKQSLFTGLGKYEKTELTLGSTLRKEAIQSIRSLPIQINKLRQLQLLELNQARRNLLNQGLKYTQANKILQNLRQQQQNRLDQARKQAQDYRQKLLQRLSPRLATQQQTQQRTRQRNRFGGSPRLRPRPRTPFGLPTLSTTPFKKRIKTSVTRTTPKGYDVFAKKKGKLKKIGSFRGSKSLVEDYLAFKLDNTLRASGLVRPSKSKSLKPIPTSITGYLNRNSKKFYRNKRGFLTEKRNFRLEKRGSEVKRIQQLRKSKPFSKKIKRFL